MTIPKLKTRTGKAKVLIAVTLFFDFNSVLGLLLSSSSSKPVDEEGAVTVLWNQAIHTDREVTANRPDIIIKNKKEKTCTLIDVAIPADRNVVQKEVEKKLKYKSLCIEIQ